MKLSKGAVVAACFRLERRLGRGGMGEVWLAHHQNLDIPCAVKFINAEAAASETMRGRFVLEAKAAAQLRTPHVVQILDHGVSDGTPYIAMEYLEGEDLATRIRRLGRLDAAETAGIVAQVARALVKAHAAGLVHRDLKPANIFLVRDEDRDLVKVLDFGVAKSTKTGPDHSTTQTGALIGTPNYMSPEQAQGTREVDYRSDLWSLAVVTFQALTGDVPFRSDALGDLLIRILLDPLPVPSQVAEGLPPGFDAWWTRAVQRDPGARFQNARELSDALAVALGVSKSESTGSGSSPAATSATVHLRRAEQALPDVPTLIVPDQHDSEPFSAKPAPASLGVPTLEVPPTEAVETEPMMSSVEAAQLSITSPRIETPPAFFRSRATLVSAGAITFGVGAILFALLSGRGSTSPPTPPRPVSAAPDESPVIVEAPKPSIAPAPPSAPTAAESATISSAASPGAHAPLQHEKAASHPAASSPTPSATATPRPKASASEFGI